MRGLVLSILALMGAGCVGAPEAAIDPASAQAGPANATAEADAAMLALTMVPISLTGTTGDSVALCLPSGSCFGFGVPGTTSSSYFEQSLEGTLDRAELTLTWTAKTPATEELLLGIAYETSDGYEYVYARGASPLVLSESGLDIPAKDVQGIYVNAYRCVAAGCASTSQDFAIEGELALLPP